jgi:hypothetical protein
MEMSHGNSLRGYLFKNVTFFLFSSTKSENRRVEQVLPGGKGWIGISGGGEVVKKGCKYCVNMVQILCTPVSK